MIRRIILSAGILLALPGLALAQNPTSATPGQAGASRSMMQNSGPGRNSAAPVAAAGKAERTAKSKDCSAKADQQGLHGKVRKTFRSKCMRSS
jgi:hypothetical protein